MWGPILFTLYCADLAAHVTEAEVVAYADDITLLVSDRDPKRCQERMDRALAQLDCYCRRNRIVPSPTKTQLLVVGARRRAASTPPGELHCVMDGEKILPRSVIKVLGVLLDEQLAWEEQSAAVAKKADCATFAVVRAAGCLGPRNRAAILRALAHPHLDGNQTALARPTRRATPRPYRSLPSRPSARANA